MTRLYGITVLAVMLGAPGVWQPVRADQPTCGHCATPDTGLAPFVLDKRHKAPPAHHLNPHWWGCGSDQYNPGCDTLKDECIFLFGSCREFYGQPCIKQWHPLLESHHVVHP